MIVPLILIGLCIIVLLGCNNDTMRLASIATIYYIIFNIIKYWNI